DHNAFRTVERGSARLRRAIAYCTMRQFSAPAGEPVVSLQLEIIVVPHQGTSNDSETPIPDPDRSIIQLPRHRNEQSTRRIGQHIEHPNAARALQLLRQAIEQGKDVHAITLDGNTKPEL